MGDDLKWGKQFVHRIEGNWEAARETSDRLLLLAESSRNLSERVMLDYQQGDFAQGRAHLERLLAVHRRMRGVPSSGYVMPALIIPLVNRINPEVGHLDYAQSLAEAVISSTSAPLLVVSVARAGLSLLAVLRDDMATAQAHHSALLPLSGTMLHTGVIAADSIVMCLSKPPRLGSSGPGGTAARLLLAEHLPLGKRIRAPDRGKLGRSAGDQ